MTPRECCEAAESGLARAGQLLLTPSPGALEESLQALSRVIELLETLASGTARDWDPVVHLAIHRVQAGARALAPQIVNGSNLVRGWMQLRLGEGYTRGGSPRFAEPEPARHLEA
jgi:hypothetical protein